MNTTQIPPLIGQYEIIGLIGRGGFGAVYKGHDIHLDRPVAIKRLRLGNPTALKEEARALSDLRHQNIAGFRQLFPEDSYWYLVMDFVEGGSLSKWILSRELTSPGKLKRCYNSCR